MKKTPGEAPDVELAHPPHGGRFNRESDGSLTLIEGAIKLDEPVPSETAPTTEQPAAGKQNEA